MSITKQISPYLGSNFRANEFDGARDLTDQRAPLNDPQELFAQYLLNGYVEEIADELDSESITDFDDDFYPYDDRSEYGEDVLAAQDAELSKSVKRLRRK